MPRTKYIPGEEEILDPIDLTQQCFIDNRANLIMEEMRLKLKDMFGVTVQGSHVTLRFGNVLERHVEVSMIVTEITDSTILEKPDPDWGK